MVTIVNPDPYRHDDYDHPERHDYVLSHDRIES